MDISKIQALKKLPLYTPTIHSDFVILGFLDEYLGRRVFEQADSIEHFYPKETDAANRFEGYLYRIKEEQGLTTDIVRKVDSQGHITFHSPEMAALVNSFYGADLQYDRTLTIPDQEKMLRYEMRFLSYDTFEQLQSASLGPSYDTRFSFLLGAYLRYGKEKSLTFANATPKAELVAKLLMDVYCDYVGWKFWQNAVPCLNIVEFEPTDELIHLFGLPMSEDSNS
jgi:hypothetical protein